MIEKLDQLQESLVFDLIECKQKPINHVCSQLQNRKKPQAHLPKVQYLSVHQHQVLKQLLCIHQKL